MSKEGGGGGGGGYISRGTSGPRIGSDSCPGTLCPGEQH